MINKAELIDLSNRIRAIQISVNDKVNKNTRNVEISEVNVEGSLVLGSLGDIREIISLVTQTKHGIMSKEDKTKLDGIEMGSNKYIHPSTHPADMIVETDAKKFVSQFLIDKWNNHNHHDLYFTKTEMGVELDKKSNVGHNHHDLYYTKSETNTELDKKANVNHGNHVPATLNDGANVMKFLHCNNVWREITPATLGTLTEDEINGLFIQFSKNLDWKESVATFADIAKTYPNPEDGWTVNVKEDNYTYRYNGSAWVVIGGNAYVHPSTHPASMISTDSNRMFVTQAQVDNWNSKANGSHGNHVPTTESANNARFLRNDNTWQAVTPGNIGAYTKTETDNLLNGKANSNHGNHIPNPETANAAKFLRNDNTWQLVTPGNIGTYTKSEIDNGLNGKANSSHGNHVPTTEGANNTRFLRNDNTWQTVTPGNIGAYTKAETDSISNTTRAGVYGSQQVGGAYSGSGGKQPPSYVGSGKVRFLMSNEVANGDSSYKDWIYMDTYSGGDVPSTTAFGISKADTIRAFLMRGAKGGSSWNRTAEIWHTVNFNPGTKLNNSGDNTHSGKLTVVKDVGSRPDYHTSQMEIRNNGGATAASIGFHRSGSSAHSIQLRDDYTGISIIAQGTGLGNLRAGTINANTVYGAVWNDYAEYFPKPLNYKTEPGDIIALNIDSDKEEYIKATEATASMVVGCHSDTYGMILGGDEVPEGTDAILFREFNENKYIPIGLSGRVFAKCIGPVKKGDKLVISEIPGVARAFNSVLDDISNVFGVSVEDKEFPDSISRVKMFIK